MLKKMFKGLSVVSSLLLLAACDPVEFAGVISVKQPMVIKSTESQPGCNPSDSIRCRKVVNVSVPVGDHKGKMNLVGRKQIQLKLTINDKKRSLNLVLPKKLEVPDNGAFEISAADLGQDFGAQGNAATKVADSETRKDYETCTYERRETVCTPSGHQVVCRDELRTVYGRQLVEFFDRRTDQQVSINFFSAQNSLLANYNGQRNTAERIYSYKSICR